MQRVVLVDDRQRDRLAAECELARIGFGRARRRARRRARGASDRGDAAVLTSTRPASIQVRSRLREYCGKRARERGVEALAGGVRRQRQRVDVCRIRAAGARGGRQGRDVRTGACALRCAAVSSGGSVIIDNPATSDRTACFLAVVRGLRRAARSRCAPSGFARLALLLVVARARRLPPAARGQGRDGELTAERLYKDGARRAARGKLYGAIKLFETLEARFPYGRYAQQAILESAYANYRAGETATAIAACDRFIRTYPNHPNVDYAYYLKGLVNFREDQGLLGYVYELDLSEREPKGMRESFAGVQGAGREVPGQPLRGGLRSTG